MDSFTLRFWKQVAVSGVNECWKWQGSKRGKGYGRIKKNGETLVAHRASYEINIGPIPEGMLVCHHCDVPACVNPRHLFIGTQKDNLRDRNNKGRFHPVKGERHGRSKLTEEQVKAIMKDDRTQREIAADYGVDRAMISHIKRGHSWKHLR